MVLVIATDAQPVAALKRFFTRVGFVLLPLSVLFIKYYPSLGQGWDEYGFRNFQGVTTNKNVLGNLVYLVGLGALWQILTLVRDKDSPDRKRHLLAHIGLVAFGVNLLYTAQCATGTACFILGAGLMLAISLPFFRQRPTAVHALILTLALVGGVGYLLGAKAAITKALGRKPDLTGRTAIWQIVIPMAPNPIGGAGFETFWVGPRVAEVARKVDGYSMTNEAHNGYIEVYLNLGVLGLCLIAIMMGHGYVRSINAFRRDPALGGMFLAYVVTVIFYNITEAGFRILHLEWFFFLLSIVAVNRIIGLNVEVPGSSRVPAYPARPLWATRMSSRPARMGSAARTSFSQDAVTTPSQRKESPARQFLVDGKKTRT
jgi:O-antigen ligase